MLKKPYPDYDALMGQPIVDWVWDTKYRYKGDEKPDHTLDDSRKRVVSHIYQHEKDGRHEGVALKELRAWRWSPGGRQWAGAGSGLHTTLLNCYVSPIIQDSMSSAIGNNGLGIMDSLTVAALTQQMGGGIGMDFSTLRPKGAVVRRRRTPASGPLVFMDMWHEMCNTIMAAGERRGAMMGTMSDDHPDLLDFIDAKHKAGRLTNFNVSILVSDKLMQAVKDDADWELGFHIPPFEGEPIAVKTLADESQWFVYKVVKARELWDKIMKSTYDHAEPGVIFIDRVNKYNNLAYCEDIRCTNPCGEQPLPPDGNCNLGAVNLAAMVKWPFTDDANIDWAILKQTVRVGVRWLDNVLDTSLYPTEGQERESKRKRRIGLGITGLGNMLQQLGVRYGSGPSLRVVDEVMRTVKQTAYEASIDLAKERGPFSAFDVAGFIKSPNVKSLPDRFTDMILTVGIRNGVLLTIAPLGTTSLLYGNTSAGLEPTFAFEAYRKVRRADGSHQEFLVEDFGWRLFKSLNPGANLNAELPDYMVTAQDLTVEDHLQVQAVCQKYIDASVSKTINVPQDYPFEEFKKVYWRGYELGLKGCTTYRPNPDSGRGSVLEVKSPVLVGNNVQLTMDGSNPHYKMDSNEAGLVGTGLDDIKAAKEDDYILAKKDGTIHTFIGGERWDPVRGTVGDADSPPVQTPREPVLEGRTYKVKWHSNPNAFYVTVNNRAGQPFEMFINSKDVIHAPWIAALTRTVSALMRKGGDLSFLVDEWKQVHDTAGGSWEDDGTGKREYVPSLVAMIGRTLEQHMKHVGSGTYSLSGPPDSAKKFTDSFKPGQTVLVDGVPHTIETAMYSAKPCPSCAAPGLLFKEGCSECMSCGWSNCS